MKLRSYVLYGIGRLLVLMGLVLLIASAVWGNEQGPAPEYPYPGALEDGERTRAKPIENEIVLKNKAAADATDPKDDGEEAGNSNREDEDHPTRRNSMVGLPAGESSTTESEIGFKRKIKEPQPRDPERTPIRVTAKGEYVYKVTESPQTRAASLRFGAFSAPRLVNPGTGLAFQDIYGNAPTLLTLFDYEFQLFRGFGKLGLDLGTGLMVALGNGKFRKLDSNRISRNAEERFTGLLLPNSVSAIYRAQYKDKQLLVPYVNGGLDYFLLTEIRDDNRPPRYAGALATHAAFGGSFLMDWLDQSAINRLDNEFGVNHIYLTAEYRMIVGLDKQYDYTDQVFNGGVLFEF